MDSNNQREGNYITDCALCGAKDLYHFGDLFESPLANNLFKHESQSVAASRYPLGLVQCKNCGHIQLSFAVSSHKLFSNYSYKTGVSSAFREHFDQYAEKVSINYLSAKSKADCAVLDVGCNDGYLLDSFKSLGFTRTFGVEPATNLYLELKSKHQVYNSFFDLNFAKSHHLENHFDIITANNVFAHTRDLSSFARAASYCLKDEGTFIFEVQYLQELLDNNLFDMIYHEHTSYHHLLPLVNILPKYNLNVVDAELVSTHGGSLRVYCSKSKSGHSKSMLNILEYESDLSTPSKITSKIHTFYEHVNYVIQKFSAQIEEYQSNGNMIWGYTAPAKATTLLASIKPEIRQKIEFVIDDSPLKQGMYIPGTQIPIYSTSFVKHELNFNAKQFETNSLGIIFAWNIVDSLLSKLRDESIGSGTYLAPLPEVRVINFE